MRILIATAIATVLAMPPVVSADGDVTIALTPDGEQLAADLGLVPAEFEARLEAQLADLYDTANVGGFLRAFANATSFASRGVGVDYAPLFRGLEVGFTANIAAAVDGLEAGEDPAAGLAPNLSLVAGLSLAKWGHEEIVLYANGFHRSTSLGGLRGSITNLGVHGQYHLFFPSERASTLLFLWTGLHLTTGIELSRWSFHLEETLDHSFDLEGSTGVSSQIDARASGAFDLSTTATTIPVELTTSARILYFAGIYVGAGVDVQLGRASADATLEASLRGTQPMSATEVGIGSAAITVNGAASPSPLAMHILAGLELNIWRLKTFVQATVVPVEGASVAFGMRLRL